MLKADGSRDDFFTISLIIWGSFFTKVFSQIARLQTNLLPKAFLRRRELEASTRHDTPPLQPRPVQSSKGGHLYTFKTTDLRIARRFRRKQFLGGLAEITIEGSTVRGAAHAAREDASATPVRWIITIVSSDSKQV